MQRISNGPQPGFNFTSRNAIDGFALRLLFYEIEHEEAIEGLAALFHHIRTLAENPDSGGLDVQDFCTESLAQLYRLTGKCDMAVEHWVSSMALAPLS